MFTHHRTQAIILDYRDIGEADKIFTFYTKDFGRVEARGRSVRKGGSKLGMGASLFSFVEIEFIQGKSYNTLTDVVLLSDFQKSKKNLGKLSLLYRISETTLSFIGEQEEDEDVFWLIVKSFQEIDKKKLSKESLKIFWCIYSFRLLYLLGYRVYTEECIVCNKKIEKECYFNPREKGVVCANCFSSDSIGIYIDDISEVFKSNADRCIKITESYINNI